MHLQPKYSQPVPQKQSASILMHTPAIAATKMDTDAEVFLCAAMRSLTMERLRRISGRCGMVMPLKAFWSSRALCRAATQSIVSTWTTLVSGGWSLA